MKMARQGSPSVDNATDLLSCSVCMDVFDDADHQPKLLPCHHTFCTDCLVRMTHGYSYVDCPTCRQRIRLASPPPGGILALQTNFYLTQMRELLSDSSRPKLKGCRRHMNKALDFFCQSCEVLICEQCAETEHKESGGHKTQEVEVAVHEQTQLLETEVAEAQHVITTNSLYLKHLANESGNLLAAKTKAVEDLDNAFDAYVEAVNRRRQQLKESLAVLYTERKQVVNSEVEKLGKQSNSLTGLVEQCTESIASGQILDILAYKSKLGNKNQEVRAENAGPPDVGHNYLAFCAEEQGQNFMELTEVLGGLKIAGALPSVVKVTELPSIAALFASLSIKVTSSTGEDLDNYPLEVEIIDVFDEVLPCKVQPRTHGVYGAMFRPRHSGLHRVRTKFNGRGIPGGEFDLNVLSNNPVLKLGQKGSSTMDMDYPRDVTVDNRNNIYVVDTGNNRIQKFDRKARLLYQFPISEETESYSSCGIAVDKAQDLIVCPEVCVHDADLAQANAILVYTKEGQLLNRYVYRDLLKRALSVAINRSSEIIIADYELNAIFIFDKSGKVLHRFGESGNEPGQFNHPTFVCIGREDTIIVSDGENDRIQVFDRRGKFLYKFGSRGSSKGQFNLPFGVAADKHGNILVVDGGNKRIQIFKEKGQFTGCIESLGDRMSAPRGITVTSNGYVLVADRDNHCVKKYKYLHSSS